MLTTNHCKGFKKNLNGIDIDTTSCIQPKIINSFLTCVFKELQPRVLTVFVATHIYIFNINFFFCWKSRFKKYLLYIIMWYVLHIYFFRIYIIKHPRKYPTDEQGLHFLFLDWKKKAYWKAYFIILLSFYCCYLCCCLCICWIMEEKETILLRTQFEFGEGKNAHYIIFRALILFTFYERN
jgi:hypothetical protein